MSYTDTTRDARSVFANRKPEELAYILSESRKRRGWSQPQLAAIAGLNERTIQRAERTGKAGPDIWIALGHAFKKPELFNKAQFPNFAEVPEGDIPPYEPAADIEHGCRCLARLNRHNIELLEHAALAGWTMVRGNDCGDLIIRRDLMGLLPEQDWLAVHGMLLLNCFASIGFA